MRNFLILAFLFFSLPAFAAEKGPEVKAIEKYLDGITTLQSRFIQTSGDGKQAAGVFMMKRPGKLRFEYDKPIRDFIVADGTLIYYYDAEMKQQRSTLISQSLADFFLRPNLKLSGDIRVDGLKRADGLLQVTLVQADDPFAGSLTLMLSEKPMQLKKWRIVDAQGLTTNVELYETQPGVKLSNSLFHYYDPSKKEPTLNK